MTTATKAKTTTEQLEQLEAKRAKAHAATRAARDERDAWDEETERLRSELTIRSKAHPEELQSGGKPKEGTEAAKLREALLERIAAATPALRSTRPRRRSSTTSMSFVTRWKRDRVQGRIEEALALRDTSPIREAAQALIEACKEELAIHETARSICIDTPTLNAQALVKDDRVQEWHHFAVGIVAAVDEGLVRPGITSEAAHRVAHLG